MKIAYITPDTSDPLAFYRGSGPLSAMRKSYENFDYEFLLADISWASLKKYDMIFIQRPFLPEHLEIVDMANKWNIPIVGDFDDWLYDLPTSNPAYRAFTKNKQNFVQILNGLDRITVATQKLADLVKILLLDQNKPIDVIPNAYDEKLFSKYRHNGNIKDRKMIFGWRGGNSHLEDLLSVKEDYLNLFASYPEWQFVFIAQTPWILDAHKFKNVQTADPLKIMEYFKALHDTAPTVMAHPLADNNFNRAKSMCSWLEATHARAAFIGPDFEEFQRDGITNYGSQKSFFDCATYFLDDPKRIVEKFWESEHYISKNLTLNIINEKRMQIFKALVP